MPVRLQRGRTKGSRLPAGTVCVTRETRWGNRHQIGKGGVETAEQAVALYRQAVALWSPQRIAECRRKLGGLDLACWCRLDQPCHADVLLEIANSEP